LIDPFIDAILHEKDLAFNSFDLNIGPIATVYFGGGTPSILSADQWHRLSQGLLHGLSITPDAEISIECNPDSFTKQKAEAWLRSGVNRITFGIQSLDNRLLRLLGRPHTAEIALAVLHDPMLDRFDSVGIDIMYGLPGQTTVVLRQTLEQLLAVSCIKHISAYELTINADTPFGRHRSMLPLPDEDEVAAQTTLICESMAEHGFEHYEISNWALPGHRSKHNSNYWSHKPYIGLGPSAHSYFHPQRWANVSDLQEYLAMVGAGKAPRSFVEELSNEQLVTEAIMLGLRTKDGIDNERFRELTGEEFFAGKRGEKVRGLVDQGLLEQEGNRYFPTQKGMMVADGLARELG
jgi:oxygen-independent coproporphyrinogen-3 oxidase